MKGVVIKKKPKPAAPAQSSSSTAIKPTSQAKRPIEDEPLIDKKRKL
jgi:hypothetical protein